MRDVIREAWWWARKIPGTLILLFGSIVAGIATKALWQSADSSGLVDTIGYGLPALRQGDIISILTGALVAPAPWMYALILIPIALGGAYIEYKHGTLRLLATLLISHVGAVVMVAGLLFLLEPTHWVWVRDLGAVRDVGLSNAGFGAIGAATAGMSLMWRRRVRVAFTLYLLAFLLYSGVIWDLTHFTALLIGFAIGPWVMQRPYAKPKFDFSIQEQRNLAAVLIVFSVMTSLVSRLYPGNGGLLAFESASRPEDATTMLLLVGTSVFLLLLAYGLYAGRRVAWWLTLFVVCLSLLTSLAADFDASFFFDLAITLLILFILVFYRRAFDVRPDRKIRSEIYRRLALLGALLLVFNPLAIYAIRTSFTPHPSFPEAVGESIFQIIGVSTRAFSPTTTTARVLTDSISYLWATAVLLAMAALIFTTRRAHDERGQFADYDKLLHQSGSSTIGWMARWPGMNYWVNLSKTAGFAYRLENNIAIVLSDPVGSRQAVAAAFESFEAMCLRRGWHPIYYAVSDTFRRNVRKQKLKSIQVGEDTVIDLPELAFSGKSWQSVRSAVNRAAKDGIRMRAIKYGEAAPGLQDQLKAIAAGWVNDKSLPEMGFTLGTLQEAQDPEVRMHLAIDQDGTVHGMTSWFPVYRRGKVVGWTIDIMQRRLADYTMGGVIEFLIAESAMAFKQEGYEFMSLSAAPLSHSSKPGNAIERLLDLVAERMEPYYGFRSLYNFKQKFNPRHEPIYLCYHDEARLPSIALAIGQAYMPKDALRNIVASSITRPKPKKGN